MPVSRVDMHGPSELPWSVAFTTDRILRGHIAARSGDALLHGTAGTLSEYGVDHAASALGAAWLTTRFAGFRIVTFYLGAQPSPAVLDGLFFHEESRGANVSLVVPNDEGVFHGVSEPEGVHCVHPVQIYLDLGAHPERAADAGTDDPRRLVEYYVALQKKSAEDSRSM